MRVYNRFLISIVLVFLIFILVLISIVQWDKVGRIFLYTFYSIVLAYILVPLSKKLEVHMPRIYAVIGLYIIILIVLGVFLLLLIPVLKNQALALILKIPLFIESMDKMLSNFESTMDKSRIPQSIQLTLQEYLRGLDKWLLALIKGKVDGAVDGMGKIAGLLTIPVLSFYFIKDREYFLKVGMRIIPIKIRKPCLRLAREINRALGRFIRGQLLISVIVGLLATIGYFIIGLPYAILLGLFAGLFEIVPYLGPVLGAIPAALIAILDSPKKLLASILVMTLVQQLESNIFTPKIMGDHVGLHPVYIILTLWIAGASFGIVGMFFAVPLVLIFKILVQNIYNAIVSGDY